jgi:branched-subunit amino acid transport protein
MSAAIWTTIAGLAVTTALIKASGPVLVGGRELPPAATKVIALLAPALLAGLLVTETFTTDGGDLTLDERVVGVGVAGVALALRAPLIVVVVLAAAATAGMRALT